MLKVDRMRGSVPFRIRCSIRLISLRNVGWGVHTWGYLMVPPIVSRNCHRCEIHELERRGLWAEYACERINEVIPTSCWAHPRAVERMVSVLSFLQIWPMRRRILWMPDSMYRLVKLSPQYRDGPCMMSRDIVDTMPHFWRVVLSAGDWIFSHYLSVRRLAPSGYSSDFIMPWW